MRNDQPKAKLAKLITTKIMTDVHTYVSDSILVEKTPSSISCDNGFPCAASSKFIFIFPKNKTGQISNERMRKWVCQVHLRGSSCS